MPAKAAPAPAVDLDDLAARLNTGRKRWGDDRRCAWAQHLAGLADDIRHVIQTAVDDGAPASRIVNVLNSLGLSPPSPKVVHDHIRSQCRCHKQ